MMRVLMRRSEANRSEMATAVAFSPTGDRLAFAAEFVPGHSGAMGYARNRVVVRDLAGDLEGTTLANRRNLVRAISFRPDGRFLAVGLGDRTVRVWDSATLSEVAILRGHTRLVGSLSFSPDGSTLATASADHSHSRHRGELKVWDVATWAERAHLAEDDGVWSVAYSPDGSTIAVGSDRLTLRGASTLEVRSELSLRAKPLCLAFFAGGRYLAWAMGWELGVWDVEAGAKIARGKAHTGPIHALAASPDGRTLATGSADGTVRLWGFDPVAGRDLFDATTEQFRERACYDWGIGSVRSLAFSPDGSIIAAGGTAPDYLILWDLE